MAKVLEETLVTLNMRGAQILRLICALLKRKNSLSIIIMIINVVRKQKTLLYL